MYIPDLSVVFKECYRVMAVGGTFIIMAPNPINYVCDWIDDDKGGYYKAVHKMPWCSRDFDESEWIEYGHTMDNYLVFYLPDETSATVSIIRIMYGGRDIDKQLNDN